MGPPWWPILTSALTLHQLKSPQNRGAKRWQIARQGDPDIAGIIKNATGITVDPTARNFLQILNRQMGNHLVNGSWKTLDGTGQEEKITDLMVFESRIGLSHDPKSGVFTRRGNGC
jgi:hypothetical protein